MAAAYYLALVCGLYYPTNECDALVGCTLSRISPALPNIPENVRYSVSCTDHQSTIEASRWEHVVYNGYYVHRKVPQFFYS